MNIEKGLMEKLKEIETLRKEKKIGAEQAGILNLVAIFEHNKKVTYEEMKKSFLDNGGSQK